MSEFPREEITMPAEPYEQLVRTARDGHVAVVRIDRPAARNALNLEVLGGLARAMAEADADDEVRAILLTGGPDAFSAGADIDMLSGHTAATYPNSDNARAFEAIRATRKPVVAAVSGFCLGGGCEIALACDIVVASDTALLGQPEIKLGIIPGAGGTQLWAQRAGAGAQALAALRGDMVGAFAARRMGLVERVVPAAALEDAALALAKDIASRAPIATRAAKSAMRAGWVMPLSGALDHEVSVMAGLLATDDTAEGIAAFIEKRPAEFRGR
jgi:enoyl-CoA hydratase/carnithine racemase